IPYWVAHAGHQLAFSRMQLGQLDEALEEADQSRQLFEAIGMTQTTGAAMIVIAEVKRRRGDLSAGRKLSQRALDLALKTGSRLSSPIAYYLVPMLLEQGDLRAA